MCLATDTTLPPFPDPVGELPVGRHTLRAAQSQALADAGFNLVDEAPAQGAYLVFTDRCYFTAEALRLLRAAGPGRLRSRDDGFWDNTGPLQDVPEPGLYELALHPGGGAPLDELDPVDVDLGLVDVPMPEVHPAMARAMRPLRGGAAVVHQVQHWSHLVRLAPLAIFAELHQGSLDWKRAGLIRKAWAAGGIFAKARSVRPARLARALSQIHPDAEVHPTAVVEASTLEAGAKVGAFSIVRASHLGPGSSVAEHSLVQMSVLGPKATVGRHAMVTAVLMMAGSMVSGGGYQASVLGRGAFVAWGSVLLDLSFGRPVMVEHEGRRQSSGHHFLGAAIGHEAVIGNGVRIHHGMAVPGGAVLVAPGEDLLRDWADAPVDAGPLVVREGRAVPLKRAPPAVASDVPGDGSDALDGGLDHTLLGDDALDQ